MTAARGMLSCRPGPRRTSQRRSSRGESLIQCANEPSEREDLSRVTFSRAVAMSRGSVARMEGAPERPVTNLDRFPTDSRSRRQHLEGVVRPGNEMELCRHRGPDEPTRELEVLVSQQVELPDHHERRRQPRQVSRARRRCVTGDRLVAIMAQICGPGAQRISAIPGTGICDLMARLCCVAVVERGVERHQK